MAESEKKDGIMSEQEKKLFDSIVQGSAEEVKSLLAVDGVRVDCIDDTGMSPLQHAAFRGRKDLCELFLAHGADVNSSHHENGYSSLMFAALSGNVEVTRLMLEAGARVDHINSVNRTAAQMAAFVGQHQVVSLINNFCPMETVEYYTKCQALEKEPRLPPSLAPALHRLINMSNLNPVGISLYLLNHKGLLENSYKVAKVLEHMCESNMKSHDTNDIMAMKTHYLACVIRQASKSLEEKNDNLQTWIKALLRGRDGDGFQEFQERFIRQTFKDFPYVESELLQQMVRNVAPVKIGDEPTALSILVSGINGQHYVREEENSCSTCGKPKAPKNCSACKMVKYCDQSCQKLHWFTHKKFCKQLAEEFVRYEAEKEKLRQADLAREMEEKANIKESQTEVNGKEDQTTESPSPGSEKEYKADSPSAEKSVLIEGSKENS
ncbi:ankyrin repeat and MYND domain-containing protein 2-like [Liolophura sinensis]|uniref:ankyrin repeat and MYND domain-containing protein 2-like n=1 Tax=Liolophura sinensis TaxID=3198878 RepID=UPI00315951D7